ncbi:hypothetical protein NUBL21977_29300 [Klebsiella quasipneumoniae]|nr:hypothetical protein NUBL21977_29300 [Klebsiella quasipneumoniae]
MTVLRTNREQAGKGGGERSTRARGALAMLPITAPSAPGPPARAWRAGEAPKSGYAFGGAETGAP